LLPCPVAGRCPLTASANSPGSPALGCAQSHPAAIGSCSSSSSRQDRQHIQHTAQLSQALKHLAAHSLSRLRPAAAAAAAAAAGRTGSTYSMRLSCHRLSSTWLRTVSPGCDRQLQAGHTARRKFVTALQGHGQ
jgi:hypothetical protein